MSCTGCETAGLFGLYTSDLSVDSPYQQGAFWKGPDPEAEILAEALREQQDPFSFVLGPLQVALTEQQQQALAQAGSAAAGQGIEPPLTPTGFTPTGEYQSATQQNSELSGYLGATGTKARAQEYAELEVLLQQGGVTEDDVQWPFGWRFTNDAGNNRNPSDPEEIYVIPLNFSSDETNGSCSSASLPDCSSGGTACSATLVYVFEVHSVIKAPASARRPDPQEPSTFTPTDPHGVTSNVSTSTSSSGFYVSQTDPRGAPLSDANPEAYVSTSTVELSVTITSTGCGKWGIWKTNFRDWVVQFAGFTQQADSRGNVPDESMNFGVYCMPCTPVVPPGGGGGQGGGKNQNPNSIGN